MALLAAPVLAVGGIAVSGPPGAAADARSAVVSMVSIDGPLVSAPDAAPGAAVGVVGERHLGVHVGAAPAEPDGRREIRQRASRSQRSAVATRPAWVRPSAGALSSRYGWRWGRLHAGIDFAAPWGSPIVAAGAGVVTFAGPKSGYGRLVVIRHADGTETAYGHMSRILVGTGPVRAGQLIASVGSAGRSTGPHLHFEVRVNDAAINPIPWLRSRGIAV